jgi:hypothetical protein
VLDTIYKVMLQSPKVSKCDWNFRPEAQTPEVPCARSTSSICQMKRSLTALVQSVIKRLPSSLCPAGVHHRTQGVNGVY